MTDTPAGATEGPGGSPSPLTIRIEEFEGPLDLLLHLARTEEIDLARLPIRRITDQYLGYLESVDFRDLDEAGAFLVLAATLVYLKSRLLLPVPETAEDDLEEDAEVLRQELEARLRAYARVKEVGVWMRGQEARWSTRFARTWSELPMPEYLPIESLSLWDLTGAYRGFLARLAEVEPTREVQPEGPPLLERMAMIVGVLEQSWYVLFSALLGATPPRPEVVVTLLAVLELVRLQRARAQQREAFGDIVIERGVGEGAPVEPEADLVVDGVVTPERVGQLEALLFASDTPLPVERIAEVLDVPEAEARAAVEALRTACDASDRGLMVAEIGGGVRLVTRSEYAPVLMRLQRLRLKTRLSRAAVETLAIVAYRQPISRPEIEQLRGVGTESVLTHLLERRLIRVVGRRETPGRPVLYGTTREFLEHFGLNDVTDLPPFEPPPEVTGVAAAPSGATTVDPPAEASIDPIPEVRGDDPAA